MESEILVTESTSRISTTVDDYYNIKNPYLKCFAPSLLLASSRAIPRSVRLQQKHHIAVKK